MGVPVEQLKASENSARFLSGPTTLNKNKGNVFLTRSFVCNDRMTRVRNGEIDTKCCLIVKILMHT